MEGIIYAIFWSVPSLVVLLLLIFNTDEFEDRSVLEIIIATLVFMFFGPVFWMTSLLSYLDNYKPFKNKKKWKK